MDRLELIESLEYTMVVFLLGAYDDREKSLMMQVFRDIKEYLENGST